MLMHASTLHSILQLVCVAAVSANQQSHSRLLICCCLAHPHTQVVVVETIAYLDKYLAIREALPKLKAIVVYSDVPPSGLEHVYSWQVQCVWGGAGRRAVIPASHTTLLSSQEFLSLGQSVDDATLTARMDAQKAEDCCTLIYTSGTTGRPKGVMLRYAECL